MRGKLTPLILAAVSLLTLSIASLRAKKTQQDPAPVSTREIPKTEVGRPSRPADEKVAEISGKDVSGGALTSEAKAEWIEDALASDDPEMNFEGERLLRDLVSSGSVSDVLAALPKATFFSQETARSVAGMQSTLCRFQDANDLAFEMIKLKFNLVFRNQVDVKPWSTICRAG